MAHRNSILPHSDDARPYFSLRPVCITPAAIGQGCTASVVTTLYGAPDTGGTLRRFYRPRGVAITPALRITSPYFGDHVNATTELTLAWNVPATSIRAKVFDLGPQNSPTAPLLLREVADPTDGTRHKVPVGVVIGPGAIPGHRYRLEFTLDTLAAELGTTSIELTLVR